MIALPIRALVAERKAAISNAVFVTNTYLCIHICINFLICSICLRNILKLYKYKANIKNLIKRFPLVLYFLITKYNNRRKILLKF